MFCFVDVRGFCWRVGRIQGGHRSLSISPGASPDVAEWRLVVRKDTRWQESSAATHLLRGDHRAREFRLDHSTQ